MICRKTPDAYAYPVDIAWGNMGGSMQACTLPVACSARLHLCGDCASCIVRQQGEQLHALRVSVTLSPC